MTARILVVDADPDRAADLARQLRSQGHDAEPSRTLDADPPPDLLIVDAGSLPADGREALLRLADPAPHLRAILLGGTPPASGDPPFCERLPRPVDADALLQAVRRWSEAGTLRQEARRRYGFPALIGDSPPMRSLLSLAARVARSEAAAILIRGESGTGKDLLARALHFESPRADRPFVTVMCTTLQDTLLESDLFGHEKGAFTDAKGRKRGMFEAADGGSLFLNEIGDMSPPLQAKLLQVLDEQTFRRVGGSEDLRVDVRVLAATNRDLEQSVREGRFRMDLFYRLNIFPISVPPLRDRVDDLPALASHFLQRYARKYRRRFDGFRPEALAKLRGYRWPGNVRELRNVLERACALGPGPEIREEDLRFWDMGARPAVARPFVLPAEGIALEAVEKDLVVQALERAGGNQSKAASLLGISRFRLRNRMKRYGLLRGAKTHTR
jgi:DNA-binding NtrC family response regulator